MRNFFLTLALFILPAIGLDAAITKDLGQGLSYFRATDPAAEQTLLLETIEHSPALVIDLRSFTAEPAFAKALHQALAKTPPARSARFVLLDADTAAPLLEAINDDSLQNIVTLTTKGTDRPADIKVATTTEEQKVALKALSEGGDLDKLTSDTREKKRYDEAKLVHDHVNGITPSDDELPADATDDAVITEPADSSKEPKENVKAEQPPHDAVLARAIQLHRSLVALKKL